MYWIANVLLAVFILPGIFYLNSPMAIEGTRHLGLPEWFRMEAGIATFVAGLVLILPMMKIFGDTIGKMFKEWAYVGLGITYISAMIAHLAVDGVIAMSFFPLVTFAVLVVSYFSYHKIMV